MITVNNKGARKLNEKALNRPVNKYIGVAGRCSYCGQKTELTIEIKGVCFVCLPCFKIYHPEAFKLIDDFLRCYSKDKRDTNNV